MRRQLVLAGVGHAQLDLLAMLATRMPPGWQVTVITSQPAFHYSGMLPAIIAGEAQVDAAQIPVAAIAAAAGMAVQVATITALDAAAHTVTVHTGEQIPYDLLSLDVGSVPAASTVPGAMEHAHAMRPFRAAIGLLERLDAAVQSAARGARVPAVIVGAGAAGVEIAFAVRARIHAAGRVPAVTIVDADITGGLPLAGFAHPSRALAATALARRDIVLMHGTVTSVYADTVLLQTPDGDRVLESVATAWVTGPAAPPWLSSAGLACDARGYPYVDERLALTDDQTAFGGGDCVTLRQAPATPKAGVYAVRMAPILAANVRAAMDNSSPAKCFAPQADFLALLSTGDGRALLRWRGFALESRWAHHLKRWIDERYLRRYGALTPR
jgi:selenide,water dikinase